tara:strand:+ start:503 stop:862 length:360 start_codon:yes stop_codon:yes gene_type:complete
MSTVRKISDIIEGIEIVSENAIKKYGRSSRSRVRIFDMAKSLRQVWSHYQSIGLINSDKRLVFFVLAQSSYGLKFNSIVRRTGLPKGVVRDWLEVLKKEDQVVLYNVYLDRYFVNKKNI